jgi:long-chain acyl-CoA synthetase
MTDTVVRRFLDTADRLQNKVAVSTCRNGRWMDLQWKDYLEMVQSIAAGLKSLGVEPGDRVAILAQTRLEWAAFDLAILGIGAITVPIYPSSTAMEVQFILQDSEAKVLVIESAGTWSKYQASVHSQSAHSMNIDTQTTRSSLQALVCLDSGKMRGDNTFPSLSLEQFMQSGAAVRQRQPNFFTEAAQKLSVDQIATIIYTSGTTGRPKGVVHAHQQILSEVVEAFPLLGVSSQDVALTFLPFAHILGRIEIWGQAVVGHRIAYAESIERIKDNLMQVKPTVMIGVPRIFEKIHAGIQAQADISPIRRKAFNWALSVGREVSRCKQEKRSVSLQTAAQYLVAQRLVFQALQDRLGGRLRFAVSGGAPLSREIAEFFHAAGLLILEGYGLTETTAAICVNTPFDYSFGTVGKPVGEVKIKIADDGEILVKSKKVMKEYYKNPEATREVFDGEWFRTGDIGEFTESGHLKITDRKKDLIKTAGGKYVAPQRLESLLKLSPFISNAHIHGDQRKYCVALLTVAEDHLRRWANEQNLQAKSGTHLLEEMIEHPKVKDLFRRAVAEANAQLASFESIKNFAVLPRDFTIESGELTPSLKVKRKIVDERYRDLIDSLY